MLILSRRAGEAIRIGGDVRVVVMATSDGSVRLGIEAPGDVTILREELVLQVESENLRARAEPRSLADLIGGGDPAGEESPKSSDGHSRGS
ncbi:carbon storage regulator [Gaopeijia maritima]|uniref:Translational regulator CsrA n=1 Tax=Gaopeijia maritima TaxID=3119007 RepID=A0ABU9ECS5_9BACT